MFALEMVNRQAHLKLFNYHLLSMRTIGTEKP